MDPSNLRIRMAIGKYIAFTRRTTRGDETFVFKLPVCLFFGACSFHRFLFSFSTLKLWDAAAGGGDDDDDDPIFTSGAQRR